MYWVLAQGDFYISRVVAAGIYVWGLWWLAIGGFYERIIYYGIFAAACLSYVY